MVSAYVPTETSAASGTAYGKLLAMTDFDQTVAGRTLKKYMDPLTTVLTDERLRAKTAAAEAQQHDGLSLQTILSTFDAMKDVLASEGANFGNFIAGATAREIKDRKAKMQDLSAQMQKMQDDMNLLASALSVAQDKIDRARKEFNDASATRMAEIAQQKAHYESLLQ